MSMPTELLQLIITNMFLIPIPLDSILIARLTSRLFNVLICQILFRRLVIGYHFYRRSSHNALDFVETFTRLAKGNQILPSYIRAIHFHIRQRPCDEHWITAPSILPFIKQLMRAHALHELGFITRSSRPWTEIAKVIPIIRAVGAPLTTLLLSGFTTLPANFFNLLVNLRTLRLFDIGGSRKPDRRNIEPRRPKLTTFTIGYSTTDGRNAHDTILNLFDFEDITSLSSFCNSFDGTAILFAQTVNGWGSLRFLSLDVTSVSGCLTLPPTAKKLHLPLLQALFLRDWSAGCRDTGPPFRGAVTILESLSAPGLAVILLETLCFYIQEAPILALEWHSLDVDLLRFCQAYSTMSIKMYSSYIPDAIHQHDPVYGLSVLRHEEVCPEDILPKCATASHIQFLRP
ncbi:hypothetical protein BKA70DRAFT_1416549 [Coprinopsis sp. MPI-PUGE-AT-0042]|nr:hypothetical protein BKA70DRAFT_1416549 [Coprinopsis sp. MPI-PUGE-AT-0042]